MRTLPRGAQQPRFLAEADCRDLIQRLARFQTGGGFTSVSVTSSWRGYTRWGRNQVTMSGEVCDNWIRLQRNVRGAMGEVYINDTTDEALVAAARRAERLAAFQREEPNSALVPRLPLEPALAPPVFSDRTSQLDAAQRVAAANALMKQASDAGLVSAGYIEVAALGLGLLDTFGRLRYFPYTQAQYSVTVRDPQGTGSGWAGVDWYDWQKIDAPGLTQRALEKCRASRHPVVIEPGRYTTILDPQAVGDFVGQLINSDAMSRRANLSSSSPGPFFSAQDKTRLGEQVVDERITISADPMDPELGFFPFGPNWVYDGLGDAFEGTVYHPVQWITAGVLTNLAYERFEDYGGQPGRNQNWGQPNSGAFRMTGGPTTVDEMVASTTRGLLVTRFDGIMKLDKRSQLYRGYTRDGLWLIEHGKISKAVRNMVFTESVLFALNNVEQLGPPQRIFHPVVSLRNTIPSPIVVPPLKIKDFNFTALADAV